MKKLLLIILPVLFGWYTAKTQTCLPAGGFATATGNITQVPGNYNCFDRAFSIGDNITMTNLVVGGQYTVETCGEASPSNHPAPYDSYIGVWNAGGTIFLSESMGGTCGDGDDESLTFTATATSHMLVLRDEACNTGFQLHDLCITYLGTPCTDPTIPTITATQPICTGSSTTLNISGTLNDATQWHIYTGSCGGTEIGTTTGSTFVVSPTSPTSYYVRGEGGCVTPGTCGAITVNVNSLDDASFSYGASAYCSNDSDPTPTITGLAGGTFSSTAGLAINASTGTMDVSASTPGTYTVTYTTSGTCPNSSAVSVTINALDDASFSYSAAAYCVNDSDPTPTITGLAGGTFSSTAGFAIIASTGTMDVSASTPGTYTVTYTTSGTCTNSSAVSVTITSISDQSVSVTDAALCPGNSGTTVNLGSSQSGINYYLRNDADDSVIDGPVAGTGSGISFNTGAIAATTTYNVYGTTTETSTSNALEFTGNTGLKKVSLGTDIWDDNFVGQNQLTVEAWVKRSSLGSLHTIVGNYNGSYPFIFRIDSDQLRLFMNNTSYVTSAATIPVGTWTHLAGTYDGASLKVYVNGVLEGTTAYVSTFIGTTNEVKIGGGLTNNTEYFPGDIADVRLWNVAKTQAEIASNMNSLLLGSESGLVANYQFNEGSGTTTANSAVGGLYPGTLVNNPAWVTGPTLTSVACDLEMATTVSVTLNSTTTGSQTLVECAGFSVTVGANTYNTTGVYTDVLTGANGCDSTVTTDLTINTSPTITITEPAFTMQSANCFGTEFIMHASGADTYVWDDLSTDTIYTYVADTANMWFTLSVTGTDTITGCSSVGTFNIPGVYDPVEPGSQTLTVCNGESVIVGSNTYSSTGIYTDTLMSTVSPCDSIVTTDLTVETAIDVTIDNTLMPTLTANQTGATYQWVDCDNGNAIIPTETNQSFTATVNGNYAVVVTVGSCSDTSACENITGVGINEVTSSVVSIYPNPTSGMFTISLANTKRSVSYTVTTLEGRIVEQANNVTTNNIEVDLTNESKGVYLLRISENASSKVYKIIRQ
jgi:hypothetical protein